MFFHNRGAKTSNGMISVAVLWPLSSSQALVFPFLYALQLCFVLYDKMLNIYLGKLKKNVLK